MLTLTLQYIKILKQQYKLDTSVRDKPVLSVDDLLLVLHHHWVLCTWVYPDEEQRLLVALLFLFAAYTGSRPCSLVDASVKKLEDPTRNTVEDETPSSCDSGYEDDNSEDGDEPAYDKDADTDMEELKSVLYEHVTILAVKVKERSVLVMFITVIHTKGEDRKPQPSVFSLSPLYYKLTGLQENIQGISA